MLFWQDIQMMFETGKFIREQYYLEYKKAENKVPTDFWSTYSAFANTSGGFIVLGVSEKAERFVISGVTDSQKIIDDLISSSRSKEKVNIALLTNNDIKQFRINDKTIVVVYIRQANEKDKPIYLNGNFRQAYIRLNTRDHHLNPDEYRLFLSSYSNKGRDKEILPNTGLEHINLLSLNKYRQYIKAYNADQKLLEKDDLELLETIGAYQKNIITGDVGLTKAGLLMFGKLHYIRQVFSHFFLDYYEIGETRYDFRINVDDIDGNILEFYSQVADKLTEFAKNKHFNLDGFTLTKNNDITRILREALANSLLHADYFNDAVSIRIVKSKESIFFENPGIMLVPVEAAVSGNSGSNCRNDFLHNMARRIGWCDRQGQGVRDIFEEWKKGYLSTPILKSEVDRTKLELAFQDSQTAEVSQQLALGLGKLFTKLNLKQQACLIQLSISREHLTHKKLQSLVIDCSARDISLILQHLKNKLLIDSTGESPRKQLYFVTQQVLNALNNIEDNKGGELESKGGELEPKGGELEPKGGELGNELLYNEINTLLEIEQLSSKVNQNRLRILILRLCSIKPRTLTHLSTLFKRKEKPFRDKQLNVLRKEGYLDYLYPETITHPNQAYITTELGKQWLEQQILEKR